MTCPDFLRPFNRAHVGVAWMLAAGIITAAALLLLNGCASNGHLGDFPGDHGCEIDPQSCK